MTSRRTAWTLVGLIALGAAVAGCGSAGSDGAGVTASAPATSASATTLTSMSTTPAAGSADVPEALQSSVDQAVADLAQRLAVDPSTITVTSARVVTWPNGAIGCEQPGMSYTQVMVDGAEIVLESGGTTYRYTMGGSKGPTLCTQRGR